MMALTVVFYLIYLIMGKMGETTVLTVGKDRHFMADVGKNVTLKCSFQSEFAAKYYWYKVRVGDVPKLISSFYTFDENGVFFDQFLNNPRFVLDAKKGRNHLIISNLQHSDTATYFCASSFSEKLEFRDEITITIKGSGLKIPVSDHRSEYQSSQSEGVNKLNCTAHGRTIHEETGVYWLRTSGNLHPGALYTKENKTCFYSLPANSQAVDCAVATCGHVLSLNARKKELEGSAGLNLVPILSGALGFTIILAGFLAVLLFKLRRSSQLGGSNLRFSADPTPNAESHTDEDVLHYAALRTSMTNRPRTQMDDTNEECVYTRVKHRHH